ncbi:MAG: hypothetical protein L0Y56_18690 [Nitrospira sp.]|nr:hypothetical protein [Nitrospira sp.]
MTVRKIDIRTVPNLRGNSVGAIKTEFMNTFQILAQITEVLNTLYDKDDIDTLFRAIDPRPAKIRRTTPFSPAGSKPVFFESADFDTGGYFDDTNADGIEFDFGGLFRIHSYVTWSGSPGLVTLLVNGTDTIAQGIESVDTLYSFKQGDFLQVLVDTNVDEVVLEVVFLRQDVAPPRLS